MVGALHEQAAVLIDQVLPFHTLSVHLRVRAMVTDGSGESTNVATALVANAVVRAVVRGER